MMSLNAAGGGLRQLGLERAFQVRPRWPTFLEITPTAVLNAASISKLLVSSKNASGAGRMGDTSPAGIALVAAADFGQNRLIGGGLAPALHLPVAALGADLGAWR